MPVAVLREQDFETEVLQSELPVLVAFVADWSNPSKTALPEIEGAATDLEGKAKVFKVDVDKSPRLAQALRVQNLPSFAVFSQGRPVALKMGLHRRKQLVALVEPALPRPEGALKPLELA